jgi:hypothetical protein
MQLEANQDKWFHENHLEKKPSQKRAGRVSQGVGPEFKPQYPIKKKILNLALGGCNMLFIINGKS